MQQPVDSDVAGLVVDATGLVEVSSADWPPEGMMEDSAEVAELAAISRHDVLVRAKSWIDEHVMYSQEKFHKNQYGHYRQDCSGYVSMCWHLSMSYWTGSIMQVAHKISRDNLKPGDSLWRPAGGGRNGHMALFVGWADADHTKPVVQEEYSKGHPCERRVWKRSYAADFTPIRYDRIS